MTTPTDDRRRRYVSVLEQRARELTMPDPQYGRIGNGATMPELADAVMAVADEEMAELRAELEKLRAAGPRVTDEPGYAHPFRLHWRGEILAGAFFPSGRIVVVDDPDYRIVSGADAMGQLLLTYTGARLEWAEKDQAVTDAETARAKRSS